MSCIVVLLSKCLDPVILKSMTTPYLFSHHHTTGPHQNPDRLTHVHNHVEMVYCTGGEGFQITPSGLIPCRPGDLFCFLPGQAHLSYCGGGREMDLSVVYFDEGNFLSHPDAREWYGEFRARVESTPSGRLTLTKEGLSLAEDIFPAMPGEFSSPRRGTRSLVLSQLTRLMLEILRSGAPREEENLPLSGRDRITHFLLYLEVNYQQEMDVEFACEFCHMSRSRFHALFKEVAATGFTAYLNQLRVDKAAQRLRADKELPVLAVAESCGYNEISHFCHQFRRYKGCSPREWRGN